MATAWLNALRTRDAADLKRLTDLPFELHEPVEYPKCAPAHATKPEEVVGAFACIFDDEFLMEELTAQPAPRPEVVPSSELAAVWAESLKSTPLPGKLVRVWLSGDGVGYELLLLINKAGVSRLWKIADYDPN